MEGTRPVPIGEYGSGLAWTIVYFRATLLPKRRPG